MKHRPFLRLTVVLLIVFFAAFIYQTKDLTRPVINTEKVVIGCLGEAGITETDIFSRVEESWEKYNARGKTVLYVLDPKEPVSFTELTSRLRRELNGLKGIDLSRIAYKRSGDGGGVLSLEITAEDILIIAIKISNVSPAWVSRKDAG